MDRELDVVDAQKGDWRDTVGAHLKKVIAEDRVRYKQRAGKVMLKEMAEQYRSLGDLLTQSQIIRFEVKDAQRADYVYQMQNPTVNSTADAAIDFATSKDIIYWPFNGEFWVDELGYYRYTEKTICRN